jgi:acetyl-CoA carboxylase carboxyl transferase subunit alpha
MKITAQDLRKFGIIDEIVAEPPGGAHADPATAAELLAVPLERALIELRKLTPAQLQEERYQKFRRMGFFEQV